MANILVVDDEPNIARGLKSELDLEGHTVGKTGPTGKEGDFTVGGMTDQQFAEYVWSR